MIMARIPALPPKLFRTRNSQRDANTDLDRLMRVRRTIAAAMDDATRERQGLQQRLDAYHAQATSLLDNSGDYAERRSEDEQAIREAEANAATATSRIGQIDAQIARLGDMLTELDRALDGDLA
jgi:chromosome segregation ATPase